MKATADSPTAFTPAPTGYVWPLMGLTFWSINIVLGQLVGNGSYLTVIGQMLLITLGLVSMFQRRVPKTEWGQIIRMSQTVLLVLSACSSAVVMVQLLRLVSKIH